MITAKTETEFSYESLRNRKLNNNGANSSPTPNDTLPRFKAAISRFPSNSTWGSSVLAPTFRAMAPKPNSRHANVTAPYDLARAKRKMHTAVNANPKIATGR